MVNVVVDSGKAIYVNSTRITNRSTKWGLKDIILEFDCPKEDVVPTLFSYRHLGDHMRNIDTEPYLTQYRNLIERGDKNE